VKFRYDDGGRLTSGFKGDAGDCVVCAIVIAIWMPYREVYDRMNLLGKGERLRGNRKRSTAREGVRRKTYQRYLEELG
jgi:hypothetical protein